MLMFREKDRAHRLPRKTIIAASAVLTVLLLSCVVCSSDDAEAAGGSMTATVDDYGLDCDTQSKTCHITAYSGSDVNLVIPSTMTVDGVEYTVTSIYEDAFYSKGMSSVVLPDHLQTIQYEAFYKCVYLKTVDFPDTLTYIGYNAFGGCVSLTALNFPESLTDVSGYAFYGCRTLTALSFPDAVTAIGSNAFTGCSGLQVISFGTGLTKVENEAFGNVYFYDRQGYLPTDNPAQRLAGHTFRGSAGFFLEEDAVFDSDSERSDLAMYASAVLVVLIAGAAVAAVVCGFRRH